METSRDSRLGDVTGGLVGEGKNTGELSLSSLKLKLFLSRDSAPVPERQRARGWLKTFHYNSFLSITVRNPTHRQGNWKPKARVSMGFSVWEAALHVYLVVSLLRDMLLQEVCSVFSFDPVLHRVPSTAGLFSLSLAPQKAEPKKHISPAFHTV